MTSWIRTNRQLLFKVLGSLLALGSLFFLFKQQSWSEIVAAVQQVTWDRFAIAVGLIFVSRFFTIARWHILMRSADVEISFGQATLVTFTGLFASNFLPTTVGGDVVRIGGAIQLGYDRAISTASVIVDRLVGMFGMAMVLPIGLLSFEQWYVVHPDFLKSALPLLGWREKIMRGFNKLFRSFQIWMKKPTALLGSLLFTWGHMLCLFSAMYVISKGLGETTSFWELAGVWCLSYFITLIPISVNGYGLQEFSVTFLLSNVAGVALSHSLVIALLMRVLFILASLPGAFFLPSILNGLKKERDIA